MFQTFWLKIQMNRKLALGLFLKVLKYFFKLGDGIKGWLI